MFLNFGNPLETKFNFLYSKICIQLLEVHFIVGYIHYLQRNYYYFHSITVPVLKKRITLDYNTMLYMLVIIKTIFYNHNKNLIFENQYFEHAKAFETFILWLIYNPNIK